MRNSHLPIARLVSGLLFAFLATACGAESAPPGRGLLDTTGGTGNPGSPQGSGPNGGSSGKVELGVDEKPPELPAPPGCGDGTLTSDEACDDGNTMSGDGCVANCLQVERGFSCPNPGQPCRAIARCGDGIVAASEQCDDANVVARRWLLRALPSGARQKM